MKILKFGGSSVRSAARIGAVVEIVASQLDGSGPPAVAVVVSALGGVTDSLGAMAAASARGEDYAGDFARLEQRHREIVEEQVAPAERDFVEAGLEAVFQELRTLLGGVTLVGECSPRTTDRILSAGERLSSLLVAAALRKAGISAQACDARRLIRTNRDFGNAQVLTDATYDAIRRHFADTQTLQVITGFIGATDDGETTTLGRGGSDLTAAIFGAALEVESIELWTDVDGVMSADPRLVPDAFSLDSLSYEELMELSHFGAKVVYPPSVLPARQKTIPLWIKNTLNPTFPGTLIEARRKRGAAAARTSPVTGVTSVSGVALLRLEGDGMAGVPGTAKRLFEALARVNVSVILISQASSEHSICFAVEPQAAERAQRSVHDEFALERAAGRINDLVSEGHQSVIAVVGEGMSQRPGISGRLFSVLGRRGINVRAIAQGSSELNISLVVDRHDERHAVTAIHDSFFRPDEATLRIFLAGVGGVGSALLGQIGAQTQTLETEHGLRLRVVGVLDSRHALLDRSGLELDSAESGTTTDWRQRLSREGSAADRERIVETVLETPGLRAFVDCTASETMAELYPRLLRAGVAVVTANKKPFAVPYDAYVQMLAARAPLGRGLYHEATVGAGLPVLHTLRSLLDSGDRLVAVEGIFSGTLAFLISELQDGVPFSQAVRQAFDRGYTEPDPREDLSGMDVARKLLILARESGLCLELGDIEVEPLVSGELAEIGLEQFWQRLPELDAEYAKLDRRARDGGQRLSYLARLADGRARVSLTTIPADHPCARLSGTDNLFAFTTDRYRQSPLVVRGPGAGTAVTAGGVFADLLRAHAEAASGEAVVPLQSSSPGEPS